MIEFVEERILELVNEKNRLKNLLEESRTKRFKDLYKDRIKKIESLLATNEEIRDNLLDGRKTRSIEGRTNLL